MPIGVPALTVNRLCGSGFQAFVTAAELMLTDQAQVVLAGTYVPGETEVHINLRLLRLADSQIIASFDYALPAGPNTRGAAHPRRMEQRLEPHRVFLLTVGVVAHLAAIQQRQALEVGLEQGVGAAALHVLELAPVVSRLELGELQPVGGGDDHGALPPADLAARGQLLQRGQGHAGVGAVEEAGAVRPGGLLGDLALARKDLHPVGVSFASLVHPDSRCDDAVE